MQIKNHSTLIQTQIDTLTNDQLDLLYFVYHQLNLQFDFFMPEATYQKFINFSYNYMLSFFIDDPLFVFLLLTGRSFLIISQTEDFSHRLTSIEPRDYRVVFVIQKNAIPLGIAFFVLRLIPL